MKRQSVTVLLLLCVAVEILAIRPVRCYHDGAREAADTVLWLTAGSSSELWKAMEIRAASGLGSSAGYGIAWGVRDSLYFTATIRPASDCGYESSIEPAHLTFDVMRHEAGGKTMLIDSRKLNKGFDVYRAENSLALEIDCVGLTAQIFGGDGIPEKITEIECCSECAMGSMGIVALGIPEIELVVSEKVVNNAGGVLFPATAAVISKKSLREDAAPVEGVWEYFDRDNDPAICRLGGSYTLGITSDDDGSLAIVYLGGAEVNASQWKPGMIKGRLVPTPFHNHYNLLWTDATMNPIDEECSATLEPSGTLRLDFPLLKTTFRLSRVSAAK